MARKQVPVDPKFNILPFIETNAQPQLTATEKSRGYLLFKRAITTPVYPNTIPAWYERLELLQGFAARGEFETLTFSIYPQRALKNLRVVASNLKHINGLGSLKNIDVRLCTYWYMRYPGYTSPKTIRRNPELLEKVDFHSSPANECQRYWLTLKVPVDAAPGIYAGDVTLQDQGYGKAVTIPVRFRVLDFKLLRDPNKFYSAYSYDLHNKREFNRPDKKKWLEKAAKNDYRAMVDYGVDMFPVLRPGYNSTTGKIFISDLDTKIKMMRDAGLTGPVPLACGAVFNALYAELVMKSKNPRHYPHWRIPKMPEESFYRVVQEKFRDFNRSCRAKGYPEFIYCPLDEVDASVNKFGAKIYQALMQAGCKIYITKNPVAADAAVYNPYVHIFCSQGFTIKYKDTLKAKHEYWAYPNHVSGERKDRSINCRGGRMTYGYGFWRSGYTTLIPWIWRWDFKPMFVFDYLKHKKISQTGNQIDENGNIIPAVYWVCFREGRDDARYIYTLQNAIVQREGSSSPGCQALVKQGRILLREIWNAIDAKSKYNGDGWEDERFDAYRWQLAVIIEKLLKFKPVNNSQASSVLIDPERMTSTACKVRTLTDDKFTSLILGGKDFSGWHSVTAEGKTEVLKDSGPNGGPVLLYTVKIDHKNDGGGEAGKYPIGWPRIALSFRKHSLDLSKYDYISMNIKVDSDRDEVADDYTFLKMNASSSIPGGDRSLYDVELLGIVEQRKWISVNIPVNGLIGNSDKKFWRDIKRMQIWLGESKYPDGSTIKFYFSDIKLLKLKSPIVKKLHFARVLTLPTEYIVVRPEIMGLNPSGAGKNTRITASIMTETGKKLYSGYTTDPDNPVVIKTDKLCAGRYRMQVRISGVKQVFSTPFIAIKGPFAN